MTITVENNIVIIKTNSGFKIELQGREEFVTIGTNDHQAFDLSISTNEHSRCEIMADGTNLRNALNMAIQLPDCTKETI